MVNEVNKNGKKKFMMNFFFKPLADLQGEYPVLEKVPVLLPVYLGDSVYQSSRHKRKESSCDCKNKKLLFTTSFIVLTEERKTLRIIGYEE